MVTPRSVLPDVPPKSSVPSYAAKLCVTTLVGDATRLGAVGGVTVIVPLPVPTTVAGAASWLSSFRSCTIVAVTVRSTAVSTPTAGSNFASTTLEVQLVDAIGTEAHTLAVLLCAAALAGSDSAMAEPSSHPTSQGTAPRLPRVLCSH